MSQYSTQENLYHFARVSGTITAGIFTGLSLCSPIISTPALSSSLLPPSTRVDQFLISSKALSGTALPVAGLSGLLFCLAAWVRPGEVVLRVRKTHGVGGGIAMNVVSDRLRQVTPLTLLLPPLLLLPLPLLAIPLAKYTARALSTSSSAQADKLAPTQAKVTNSDFADEQLEKDVMGWNGVWAIACLMGLGAATIGGCGLIGWGL